MSSGANVPTYQNLDDLEEDITVYVLAFNMNGWKSDV